jgi:hypothetical protein
MSDEFFDYEHQEPKNNLIAFLLVTSCIFVVAVCGFLSWMFIVMRDNEHNRKLNQATYVDLQELRKNEDAKLGDYQYVDQEKGMVRIPVERAMQLMAEEAKSNQPKTDATPAGAKPEAKPAEAKPATNAPVPGKAATAGPTK